MALIKKSDLSKIEWYAQAANAKVLYVGYPWSTFQHLYYRGKSLPKNCYFFAGVYIKGDYWEAFWSKKKMRDVADWYYKKYCKSPKQFIKTTKSWELAAEQINVSRNIIVDKLAGGINSAEALDIFLEFSEKYKKLWSEMIFLDAFDLYGEEILKKITEKYKITIDQRAQSFLMSPDRYSIYRIERIERIELVKEIIKKPKLLANAHSLKNLKDEFPEFYKKLLSHTGRYSWIYNDYSQVEKITPRFLLNEIIKNIKEKNFNVDKEIKTLRAKKYQLIRQKEKYLKNNKFPREVVKLCEFLGLLSSLRDIRKAMNQQGSEVIKSFLKNFSQYLNVTESDLENYFYWELVKAIKTKKSLSSRELNRLNGCIIFSDAAVAKNIILGPKSLQMRNILESIITKKCKLKGMTAHPGKVVGIVKIIRGKKDFKKMKKSNILVAPNTRPEYIPIMKIAKGIISVEGGVTCHSAIVSRELKIPCLVGVQSAISNLRDGQRIELNADDGTVTILN